MKLLLRRNQKKALMGGSIKFILEARAELTDIESENVKKYKVGNTMIYTNLQDRGSGLLGVMSRAMRGIEVTVNDLVHGKHVECKDIVEMVAIEDQLKEASQTFKRILDTAARFGGEEIVEIS
jgi:hypothetical protein